MDAGLREDFSMRPTGTLSRRSLLRRGAHLAAGAAAAPYVITSTALGGEGKPAASNRLVLGFIGVGGMGTGHLKSFLERGDVEIVAVADVFEPHRERALELIGEKRSLGATGYNDYRELLARRDVDAVVIATPDHWHALTAIHACEAGKDVYCEKPLSLTIREARWMVEAARGNGTVFQVGSQQRSSPQYFRQACEVVRSGRIGRLQRMRAAIGGGPTCGWDADAPPPAGLDWEFWQGPAPWHEFNPRRCPHDFRWFYEYSGGKMTDWGAHHNDIAQWGNGSDDTGPVRTEPVLAEFPTDGLFDTAVRFEVKHTYANGVVLETSSEGNDVEFHGTDGWIKVNRERIEASKPEILKEPLGAGDVRLYESPGHHEDWLNCIRTRSRPIADVEIGCRSVIVCHLGTIALRTGKTIEWDPSAERITNDETLNRWLHKPYRGPWRF